MLEERTNHPCGLQLRIRRSPLIPAPVIEVTRLARLDALTQERLINWGYASCDASVRTHLDPTLPPPTGFPYPAAKV